MNESMKKYGVSGMEPKPLLAAKLCDLIAKLEDKIAELESGKAETKKAAPKKQAAE